MSSPWRAAPEVEIAAHAKEKAGFPWLRLRFLLFLTPTRLPFLTALLKCDAHSTSLVPSKGAVQWLLCPRLVQPLSPFVTGCFDHLSRRPEPSSYPSHCCLLCPKPSATNRLRPASVGPSVLSISWEGSPMARSKHFLGRESRGPFRAFPGKGVPWPL